MEYSNNRKLKLDEFNVQVLERMLDRFYKTRVGRLESISLNDGAEFEKWTIFVCIEARVIATYLLDIYIAGMVEDKNINQKEGLTKEN